MAAGAAAVPAWAIDVQKSSFRPDWESLKQYRCPDWFRDAKLGFWSCWGPECVPEQGDWYARNMYIEGHEQYKYHLETYGHPSKHGYKDIVPLWKAENWDPQRLMRLYKNAGAKYFCAIAQHHDNFDCWNSKFINGTRSTWGRRKTSPVCGPGGAMQGLRFGVTEHLGASWAWFGVVKGADKFGPMAGVPYDGADPSTRTSIIRVTQTRRTLVRLAYARFLPAALVKPLAGPDRQLSSGPPVQRRQLPFGSSGWNWWRTSTTRHRQWHDGKIEAVYNCKDKEDGGRVPMARASRTSSAACVEGI